MDALYTRQRVQTDYFNRAVTAYNQVITNQRDLINEGYLESRKEHIDRHWKLYEEAHVSIVTRSIAHPDLSNHRYFTHDEYGEVESVYHVLLGEIQNELRQIRAANAPPHAAAPSPTHNISVLRERQSRLPTVDLPKFNGAYSEWETFHDLFNAIIEDGPNRHIAKSTKLNYLKSCVSGDAARLIKNIRTTDANYDRAWDVLKNRYNNKRVLVHAQLSTIFSQPAVTSESASTLRTLLDTTRECIESLQNLGTDTSTWSPIIVFMVTQRLPTTSHQLWEQGLQGSTDVPTWSQLTTFLEARFRALEAVGEANSTSSSTSGTVKKRSTHSHHTETAESSSSTITCPLCPNSGSNSHVLRLCPKFKEMTSDDRIQFVKTSKHNICFNCLASSHRARMCKSRNSCFVCNRKHHTMLHSKTNENNEHSVNKLSDGSSPHNIQTLLTAQGRHTILPTAQVLASSNGQKAVLARALIDAASEGSFVTETLVNTLRLKRTPQYVEVSGLGQSKTSTSKYIVSFSIAPRNYPEKRIEVSAFVLPKLTNLLPSRAVSVPDEWTHIQNLPLADSTFHQPGKVEIILGADIYNQIMTNGMIHGQSDAPLAQNTVFGWVITGPNGSDVAPTQVNTLHTSIDEQLRRFWEINEISSERKLTAEEQRCERHFNDTHQRNEEGRFIVRLPFKDGDPPKMGASWPSTSRRLFSLERRFARETHLQPSYRNGIQEYLDSNQMEIVPPAQLNHPGAHYLPHQPVLKDSSSTTKLRIVFDASNKTTDGKSLNDHLIVGPTIQEDLVSILMRWRKHPIVFTADIKQMYRQVEISPQDADYQRLLWRNNPEERISTYRLTTVTFGMASSQFLAVRCIKQLAIEGKANHPIGSIIIDRDMYVDNLYAGADSINEAIVAKQQCVDLLNKGCFPLRKWAANEPELVRDIPLEDREIQNALDFKFDATINTLGMRWNPVGDHFNFNVTADFSTNIKATKRNILSDIARLFDPMGFVEPCTVAAKSFIKKLWLAGLGWDDEIPPELAEEWHRFRSDLPVIANITIPRWLQIKSVYTDIEIHGFSDASERAYAAAVYLRTVDNEGSTHANLIVAKSRTAPIKHVSLPRLELCAAVLLSRLIKSTTNALNLPQHTIIAWTDSTTTLAWIRGSPLRWKIFVANRVTEIHETLNCNAWRHIRTHENPADLATRGITATQLIDSPLWWYGPDWLRQAKDAWPIPLHSSSFATKEEERNTVPVTNAAATQVAANENDFLLRFSSFQTMVRIAALCLRFKNNATRPSSKQMTYLTSSNLQSARDRILQIVQMESFADEYNDLLLNKEIRNHKSSLIGLHPYIDEHTKLIHAKGRLENANIRRSRKFPIVLPKKHHVTDLIIWQSHIATMHGGLQLTLNVIRQQYWIIDARRAIRQRLRRCTTCFKWTSQPQQQLMGSLPAPRVNISHAFTHTGVDYAGPFTIKTRPGRNVGSTKGYLSIFICLATKAIHVEVVSDLTTDAFLAALRRFISLHGMCNDIYSDCGTNFVGAQRVLDEDYQRAIRKANKDIAPLLANLNIRWHFNPPAAPHFGGLWEAGVKSVKYHLRRIIGPRLLTFEELSTVVTQIAAILNSRPLCPVTNDIDDLQVITPGHFIIGRAPLSPPDHDQPLVNISHLNRWQLLQRMRNDFWYQWSHEYLVRLQNRPKWMKQKENVCVGQIVLVRDDRLPPQVWELGRITKLHHGRDGLVRVVTLKTARHIIERAISKISPLPTIDNELVH